MDSLLIYRTLEGMHNSCNIERCDNPYAITGAGSGSIAFAVEPRRLFYEDHAGGPVVDGGRLDRVFRCDSNLDAGCFDVAPMFVAADVSFLGVSGDTLYAVANGELLACSVDGCTNAPEVLVKDLGEVSAFVVDDKYAYIARPGERGTKTGSIVACALPKCAGGLRTLASGLAFPNSLHIADGVLYWSNAGDGPGSGSIQKVRP